MAKILKAVSEGTGGHWYSPTGEAAYEMPKKDGTGMRPTTLRDARALGLLPSVTSVLSVLDRPQLTNWKVKNAVLAAGACPRADGEPEEDWVGRVLAKASEPTAEAANLGTRIHGAIEAAAAGREWDSGTLGVYVAPVLAWLCAKQRAGWKIMLQEGVVVNLAEGFAGRVDCAMLAADGAVWLLDWKSRKTRPQDSDRTAFSVYDGHRLQAAAYVSHWADNGIGWGRVHCANVFVSSTEPGRFAVVEHENVPAAWAAFKAVLEVWRWQKLYDPRRNGGGV